GRLTSVIFLGGCNARCPFCQNHELWDEGDSGDVARMVSWGQIREDLRRRRNWLDGVVISGGEPVMHPELPELCRAVKKLGFALKLDTNGTFPYALMRLCDMKLVDYVALDIKTALDERYSKACGREIEPGLVRRTLQFLLGSGLGFELRTTLVPGLVGPAEIDAIAQEIRAASELTANKLSKYALQQFVPDNAWSEDLRRIKPYDRAAAEQFAARLESVAGKVVLRGKFEPIKPGAS
ncbi:MAG: anaerobic ribonucleoside-triphosphate reductase activating protein, partial [candidate division WOR-3 bacterium]